MNIAVCLKQVPGTTKVKIDPQTNTLVRQGIENIVNPFDAYALEEGVRLKEQHGGKECNYKNSNDNQVVNKYYFITDIEDYYIGQHAYCR